MSNLIYTKNKNGNNSKKLVLNNLKFDQLSFVRSLLQCLHCKACRLTATKSNCGD